MKTAEDWVIVLGANQNWSDVVRAIQQDARHAALTEALEEIQKHNRMVSPWTHSPTCKILEQAILALRDKEK